jgi:hypothetical protein
MSRTTPRKQHAGSRRALVRIDAFPNRPTMASLCVPKQGLEDQVARALDVFLTMASIELSERLGAKARHVHVPGRDGASQRGVVGALSDYGSRSPAKALEIYTAAFRHALRLKLLAVGKGPSKVGRPRSASTISKPKRLKGAPRKWDARTDAALREMVEMDIQARRKGDFGNTITNDRQAIEQVLRDSQKQYPGLPPLPSSKTLQNRLAVARKESRKRK